MSEFADRLAARANEEGLVDVAYATVDTPLGTGLVAATPQGPGARRAARTSGSTTVLARLAEEVSPRVLEFPARLDEARRELDEYFEGRRDRFELPLDWRLSHPGFYRRVLRATARVPFGEVITYGEAAQRAGNPPRLPRGGHRAGLEPDPDRRPLPPGRSAPAARSATTAAAREMKRFLLELEGAL